MRTAIVGLVSALWMGGLLVTAPRPAGAQVALDRIVARVNNKIITESDVRQARLLKLVDDPTSDGSTQQCLENRLLILAEIARQAPLAPSTESDMAALRANWEGRIGGRSQAPGMLSQARMSEGDLQTWLRDDLRIQAQLKRQFGGLPDADRVRAMSDWLARLRQRAGLN